jgi:A/G-specific adenine glycosylase
LLDGNVIRVLTRLHGISENPKEKSVNARLWCLAGDLVQAAAKTKQPHACSHLNQSMMELGALICTPRRPQCLICPVQKFCMAYREGRTEELPNLGERQAATARYFTAFVIHHGDKYLVRQRPAGVVNAHLWEFPNVETGAPLVESQILAAEFAAQGIGKPSGDLTPLCTIKHSITRYRITLDVFQVTVARPAKKVGRWLTVPEMQTLAFTSAHGKILKKLL